VMTMTTRQAMPLRLMWPPQYIMSSLRMGGQALSIT
jgi:hypothetical protein